MAATESQLKCRMASSKLQQNLPQNSDTAVDDPQHVTPQNGLAAKIHCFGFLPELEPHCPVPEATELPLAAFLSEIRCLSRLTSLAEDIIISKGFNKQRDTFSSSISTVHLVVDMPTLFNRN